jgi:hypothetical protein
MEVYVLMADGRPLGVYERYSDARKWEELERKASWQAVSIVPMRMAKSSRAISDWEGTIADDTGGGYHQSRYGRHGY